MGSGENTRMYGPTGWDGDEREDVGSQAARSSADTTIRRREFIAPGNIAIDNHYQL
jgi:hypothetical protein